MKEILFETWRTVTEMSVYLLFGFFVAGLLSLFISPKTVQKHLGRGRWWPVIKASIFGVPLPLCSCGVLPVAASLREHGATKAATTAFLISTPQTGVDSILVTYSLMGTAFAIFRPVAAFLSGIFGGLLVSFSERHAEEAAPAPVECSCHTNGTKPTIASAFHHAFVTLPRDLAVPLLVGVLLSGLITTLVPANYFAGEFGGGFMAKLAMLVIGIPIYVCATASVPIAAAFMTLGLSPGAALVFLMTGPATNAAAFATVAKIMGWKTVALYILSVAVTALLAGVLLDQVFVWKGLQSASIAHNMMPPIVKNISAVVLIILLAAAKLAPRKNPSTKSQP